MFKYRTKNRILAYDTGLKIYVGNKAGVMDDCGAVCTYVDQEVEVELWDGLSNNDSSTYCPYMAHMGKNLVLL